MTREEKSEAEASPSLVADQLELPESESQNTLAPAARETRFLISQDGSRRVVDHGSDIFGFGRP